MIVAYIDAHRNRLGVEPICRVLTQAGTQIAPSTYSAAKTRPPSARSVSDASTTALIERVHADNYGATAPARSTPSCTAKATRSPAAPSSGSCAPPGFAA